MFSDNLAGFRCKRPPSGVSALSFTEHFARKRARHRDRLSTVQRGYSGRKDRGLPIRVAQTKTSHLFVSFKRKPPTPQKVDDGSLGTGAAFTRLTFRGSHLSFSGVVQWSYAVLFTLEMWVRILPPEPPVTRREILQWTASEMRTGQWPTSCLVKRPPVKRKTQGSIPW